MKKTKQALMLSVVSLILCISMLLGTTYAWFTDNVTSSGNIIQSGNLDAEMYWTDDLASGDWYNAETEADGVPFDYDNWEPGYTEVRYVKIKNAGNLAFKYSLTLGSVAEVGKLAEVIGVYYSTGVLANVENRNLEGMSSLGYLADALNGGEAARGELSMGSETIIAVALHMDETAGNEYQGESVGDGFVFKLVATQATAENDSFDNKYDEDALFPELKDGTVSVSIKGKVKNGKLKEDVSLTSEDGRYVAVVQEGTLIREGVEELKFSVANKEKTDSNVALEENEILRAMDVHVEGLDDANTVPVLVTVKEAMSKALNIGNYALYHVEGDKTVVMTANDLTVHNGFTYDPATGDVVLAMAKFSEVAIVAEEDKAWKGNRDYLWYDASKTELTIANADQLAGFGAIVGGMAEGIEQDSFSGKTVKLIADINLGDKESENNPDIIFYPIGYHSNDGKYEKTGVAVTTGFYNFCGTFDGNGHTVANFYHNTWEMKGDNNYYDATLQYYRDGMGLFGRIYGGTVKNLTVSNFSSDGEYTTTGVIAAYADGATFENIAIFDCNPRVYNIGNGGIVGCVGWYAKEADLKTTFKNITVDNSNKISALWGSYDVACGGILGQYYPTSGQSSVNYPVNAGIHFENCHVSAQMDVYNDVCANYQYYAYRYTGMLIGSVRENVTIDGKSYPKMNGITAKDCTVHFGTWNDYYYCEIIDNTTASYTHDYQMSRLTEIKAINGTTITYLDGTTGTVPASGRANYVIVNGEHATENATCYHFKDGAVWTHDMGGIQTGIDENGDGQDDLKEDKQHIYLEFNNLVTGYGWGVTTKGVGDLAGVTILDREVANSVDKFKPAIDDNTELVTESTVTIDKLFAAMDNAEVDIKSDNVQVTISPFGTTSTVSGTYTANTTDWTQGTLTFSGVGQAVITITDYYFCNTATVTVNVVGADKFDTKFVNYKDYLYRVGNADKSTVALGTIFEHNGNGTINSANVDVTFTTVAGNANGIYTANTSNWTNGTIQFTGTGVVKVTIKDATSTAFILNLEVVDAVNATGATNATANNVVLLNNISGGFTVSDGYAFYGNGFKVTCSGKGTYLNHGGMTLGYVNVQTGGILDNVQVICDIYPNAFVYSEEVKVSSNLDKDASTSDRSRYMYQLSAISVSGDGSVVSNCYAYGGRNNIFVGGGNVTIENTVTECGTLSNIQIAGVKDTAVNTVTIKDVTTIQYKNASTYNSEKIMLGLGIMVGDNESTANPYIILQGDLKQYNWVTSDDTSVSNTYAKTAINSALAVTKYGHTINGKTTVNMGIAYLNSKTTTFPAENDQRTNKQEIPYVMEIVKIGDKTGYVYSIAGSEINGTSRYNAKDDGVTPYKANAQRDIVPKPTFSLGSQAVSGEDRYLTGDINGITARYEKGQDAFTLDITKLMISSKYGSNCTVNAICIDPEGNTLNKIVTLNKSGIYTLKFTVVDNTFYCLKGEEVVKVDKTIEYIYTVSIKLTIAEPSVPDATLTVGSGSYTGKYTDSTADGSKKLSINPLTPLTITDAGTTFTPTANVKSVDISYSATGTDGNGNAFGGTTTITVTYNEGQVLTIVLEKPTSNSPGNPKSITYSSSTGEVKSSNTLKKSSCKAASWAVSSYSFTGKNGKTVTAKGVTFSIAEDTSGGGCVTSDTLVMLVDGTQKRIDEVTFADKLLVWDFDKGEYTTIGSSIIENHGYDWNNVIKLAFEDGTTVKVVNVHGFFDADLNKWVDINAANVEDYIGHSFVQVDGDSYKTVKLVSANATKEYIEAWSILTVDYYNFVIEGLFSITPPATEQLAFFGIGEDMKYDADAKQADIEKYGLFTYDEFKHLMTYEQFEAMNVAEIKVAIGKGLITYEEVLWLIETYC